MAFIMIKEYIQMQMDLNTLESLEIIPLWDRFFQMAILHFGEVMMVNGPIMIKMAQLR